MLHRVINQTGPHRVEVNVLHGLRQVPLLPDRLGRLAALPQGPAPPQAPVEAPAEGALQMVHPRLPNFPISSPSCGQSHG